MLIEEFRANEQHNPHEQNGPAQTPLAAQNVRQRRTIPTIQLSWATISAAVLAVLAGTAFGIGVTQIRAWDAEKMTVTEAQRATVDFVAVAALSILLALAAMVIWAASVTVSKQQGARDRAQARHEEARGWAEAHDRLMIEQYTALARRVVGLELLVEEYGAKAVADATRIATQYVGVLTHRVEQVEALVEQAGKGGVVGKAVASDIGAIRAEIQVLRRDHDELSEEVGRSKVARLRSAAPPDGR